MKKKVKETVERFLRDVTPYSRPEDYIEFVDREKADNIPHLTWFIYTNDHIYTISASFDDSPLETNWMGCGASTRKPRAGEEHNRGNDLPDGNLTRENWGHIKNAIIRYELVKLSPKRKYLVDEECKDKKM